MAERLDERMKRWIESVLPDASISLGPPQSQPGGSGIGLYLLDLLRSSAMSAAKPAPLEITSRYLVTAWADQPETAHDTLTQLLFAALINSDFEVEKEAPSVSLWRAFGVTPQPAFLLRVPYRLERERAPVKLVTQPVKVEVLSRIAFYGRVLGPNDLPVSDCLVEVPSLGLVTISDHEGCFDFAAVPAPGNTQFLLKARSRVLSVISDQSSTDRSTPMLIRFTSLED